MEEGKKAKKKVGLYLSEETYQEVKETYKKDHCSSLTEFMEKAVEFYLGYVKSEHMVNYLAPTIMSSVNAASDANATRISRMLFKLAVESAVMNNLIAATVQFDPEQYNTLRRESERMVRKTNGDFGMTDALKWQQKMNVDE